MKNADGRDRGITDADRERMAAFADSRQPGDLLGDEEGVRSRDGSNDEAGEATAALAEQLRERLTVGEERFAESHELPFERATLSVGDSLAILADSEPAGLDVIRVNSSYPIEWRIERTDDARGGGSR
jgi:hypothetical protein